MIHLWPSMLLACVLVGAGLYGVLARRNAVLVLIGLELLLNAANLLLVTFDAAYADRLHSGQVLTLFVVTVAAAEVGVALAVILLLFRRRGDVDLLASRQLGEPHDILAPDVLAPDVLAPDVLTAHVLTPEAEVRR